MYSNGSHPYTQRLIRFKDGDGCHKLYRCLTYKVSDEELDMQSHLIQLSVSQLLNLYEQGQREFHNLDFSACDLSGLCLPEIDLSFANLTNANLEGIDLQWARLRNVNLAKANLTHANLRRSCLRQADLTGATLVSADLRAVDFSGANLVDANLADADIWGAIAPDGMNRLKLNESTEQRDRVAETLSF